MLSFFYDAVGQPWGFDPKDAGRSRVICASNSAALRRMEPPSDLIAECRFNKFALSFDWMLTVPPSSSPAFETLKLNDVERLAYFEMEGESTSPSHQLLGHPNAIQGDMALECQLVSNGLYCGDATGYEEGRRRGLTSGAADWRLLLQIDSDDDLGWMWGDTGRVYYWIPKEALRRRAFDETWTVLQCS